MRMKMNDERTLVDEAEIGKGLEENNVPKRVFRRREGRYKEGMY
jgi:hypothetical protein